MVPDFFFLISLKVSFFTALLCEAKKALLLLFYEVGNWGIFVKKLPREDLFMKPRIGFENYCLSECI